MQWSKLRKQVEDMFADSIKGRVQLHTTGYHKAHDEWGRHWITIDGREIANMPHFYEWRLRNYIDQPNLPNGFAGYMSLFAKGGLGLAMNLYLTMSINDILGSQNVLVRAIGMLDRRLGKRRLGDLELENAHPLVRLFHHVRCEAEGIPVENSQKIIGTMNLRHPRWPNAPAKRRKRRNAAAQSRN